MKKRIPALTRSDFEKQLLNAWDISDGPPGFRAELSEESLKRLYVHFQELRRWNAVQSLVGPGTASETVERHYAESLAAFHWFQPKDRCVVDMGSGGGFPGWILAAVCPELEFWLIEPRQKKCAFLEACSRKSGLSCHILDVRVDRALPIGLPPRVDVVTCRALRLLPCHYESFRQHSPNVRFFLWCGGGDLDLAPGWEILRQKRLPNSEERRLVEIAWRPSFRKSGSESSEPSFRSSS